MSDNLITGKPFFCLLGCQCSLCTDFFEGAMASSQRTCKHVVFFVCLRNLFNIAMKDCKEKILAKLSEKIIVGGQKEILGKYDKWVKVHSLDSS